MSNLFPELDPQPAPPENYDEIKKLHRPGQPTSRAAAIAIFPSLGALHRETLGLVREHPDSTANELAAIHGAFDIRRIGRRLPELLAMGIVTRGGPRRCRRTGRTAYTWRAAE
jgi:hypothetical protein